MIANSASFPEGSLINRAPAIILASMRHAKSAIMLDHYTQTDMEELIAVQELMLEAIFRTGKGSVQ